MRGALHISAPRRRALLKTVAVALEEAGEELKCQLLSPQPQDDANRNGQPRAHRIGQQTLCERAEIFSLNSAPDIVMRGHDRGL